MSDVPPDHGLESKRTDASGSLALWSLAPVCVAWAFAAYAWLAPIEHHGESGLIELGLRGAAAVIAVALGGLVGTPLAITAAWRSRGHNRILTAAALLLSVGSLLLGAYLLIVQLQR